MAIALASFVRERAQLPIDISFWFFAFCFLASVISVRVGLLLTAFLLDGLARPAPTLQRPVRDQLQRLGETVSRNTVSKVRRVLR